jgi:hypothetical protein
LFPLDSLRVSNESLEFRIPRRRPLLQFRFSMASAAAILSTHIPNRLRSEGPSTRTGPIPSLAPHFKQVWCEVHQGASPKNPQLRSPPPGSLFPSSSISARKPIPSQSSPAAESCHRLDLCNPLPRLRNVFHSSGSTRTLVSIQVTEGAGAEGQVHLVLQLLRTCLAAVCPFEIGRVLEPGQFQILPPGCLLAPGARLGKLGTNCILIAPPGASAPFLLSQAFRTTASPRTSLQGLPDSFHQYFFKF